MSAYPERFSGEHEGRPLLSHRSIEPQAYTHDNTIQSNYPDVLQPDHEFGGTEARAQLERSLLRKLDRRMSILILIYILNYIDRNNAAAARLRGFEEDLHLEGNQFASILSVLYIGYILMQIPSNMLLVYLGKPSIYLPACMVIWGGISILTGVTTTFRGALCTRFFLGFVEAAFFPGALFLISKWYKRNELSQRTALLFCGSLISNAFGTLIASGILDTMDGFLGYAAWRWLFFVEGSLTIFVAIGSIFILPDFPENSSGWLTPGEKALALHRMVEDACIDLDSTLNLESGPTRVDALKGSKHAHGVSWEGLELALTDWKVWWLAATIGIMTIIVSFSAFFPTLSATMGYNTTMTLLLCAPPWILSTIVTVVVSKHSDRTGERYWHIVLPLFVGVLGFLLAMSTMNIALRYLSLFLMAQAYAGYVCFLAWASGTISGPSAKRAVALAFINCGSTIGNIVGSYVWPSWWGPTYSHSYAICILAAIVSVSMCFAFRRHLASLNLEAEMGGNGHKYLL